MNSFQRAQVVCRVAIAPYDIWNVCLTGGSNTFIRCVSIMRRSAMSAKEIERRGLVKGKRRRLNNHDKLRTLVQEGAEVEWPINVDQSQSHRPTKLF